MKSASLSFFTFLLLCSGLFFVHNRSIEAQCSKDLFAWSRAIVRASITILRLSVQYLPYKALRGQGERPMNSPRLAVIAVLCSLVFALSPVAAGAEADRKEAKPPAKVYVPYDDLKGVFEKEPQG